MIRKWRTLGMAMLLAASVTGPAAASAAAADLSFTLSASSSRPAVNQEFQVTVQGRQLADVYGYEIHLSYDPAALEFEGTTDLGDGYSIDPIVSGSEIWLAHTAIGSHAGVSGSATLAKLNFKALVRGASAVRVTGVKLVDSNLDSRSVESGASVVVDIGASAPSTPQTPSEPSASPDPGTPTQGSGPIELKPTTVADPAAGTATSTVDGAKLADAVQAAKADPKVGAVRLKTDAVDGADTYVVKLPTDAIGGAAGGVPIEIATPNGTATVSGDRFRGSGGDVEISLGRADAGSWTDGARSQIGSRPAVTFGVSAGGAPVALSGAPVELRIPYEPSAGELAKQEHLVILSIDEQGRAAPVPSGKYDPATGTMTFAAAGTGTFAVAFVEKTFADVAGLAWAKEQVEVLAAKGIVNGLSEDRFEPGAQVTRADFLVLLARTLELRGEPGEPFADVPEDAYYSDALRLARALGIAQGGGDNSFRPLQPITREDMMVLTAKALRAANRSLDGGTAVDANAFTDRDAIAGYAVDSVDYLLASGVVHGSGDRIQPKSATTRAEAAVLLYNLYRALK